MKIIGIGGLPRSGKDTLAELLIEAGYFGVSFGDIVRGFSRKRHADKADPISVANMTETSNWLRETHGPDVILQEALKQYRESPKSAQYKGLALYSVRAPVELDFIVARGGEVVWVETSDVVRYDRAMKNLRPGEPKLSFDDFKAQEALQWQPQPGIPAEAQMNVAYIKEHATIVIENNGADVEAFKAQVKQTLKAYL